MTVARALRAWRAADYALALEAISLAVRIEVPLRRQPLPAVVARLGRHAAAPAALREQEIERLTRFTALAYRVLPWPGTCLRECLVLLAMLRRRGIAADLRLGVRRAGERIGAHAWIERPGLGAWDPQAASFAVLESVPSRSAAALDR